MIIKHSNIILSTAIALALAACTAESPTTQQAQAEADAAGDVAGAQIHEAAVSADQAAEAGVAAGMKGVEAGAMHTAEEMGEASIVAQEAAAETAVIVGQGVEAVDQATDPIQQAYEDGRRQQAQEEAVEGDLDYVPVD